MKHDLDSVSNAPRAELGKDFSRAPWLREQKTKHMKQGLLTNFRAPLPHAGFQANACACGAVP